MKLIVNDDMTITRGSTNIFADLGFADPEAHLLKAGLVTRIRAIISDSGQTQTEVGRRVGLGQSGVSRLLRGQFRDVSFERLLRMLTKLGCDVDIVVRGQGLAASVSDTLRLRAHPRSA